MLFPSSSPLALGVFRKQTKSDVGKESMLLFQQAHELHASFGLPTVFLDTVPAWRSILLSPPALVTPVR